MKNYELSRYHNIINVMTYKHGCKSQICFSNKNNREIIAVTEESQIATLKQASTTFFTKQNSQVARSVT